MRKARVDRRLKKVDVVLTSARYQDGGVRLSQARGFERRGAVWSDTLLFDRETLVKRVRGGRRVVVGRERDLPGNFEIGERLRLENSGWLVAKAGSEARDDLAVPLF